MLVKTIDFACKFEGKPILDNAINRFSIDLVQSFHLSVVLWWKNNKKPDQFYKPHNLRLEP